MGTGRALFSVVIPAYNAEKWLGQTLESWVQQTIHEFEVIVVDDGSQDGTVSVAETFRSRLNLKVIRERHNGAPARPCNVGIRAAQGEVIVHCDADDLATPDRLACIQSTWESAGRRECLMFSDFAEINEHGSILRTGVLADYSALQRATSESLGDNVSLLPPEAAFAALLEGAFIRPCAAATPKIVLERIGGFNESLRNAQDYDLYLRISREYPLVWSRRALGLYRISPGNISSRSAIQLVPSKLAILCGLLDLPLTHAQAATVRRWIAANLEGLGYEYGNQGEVRKSFEAYWKAFLQRPTAGQVRGMAASLAKYVLRWRRDLR